MKKFLLTIFFLSFISFLHAQTYSGAYYVGANGTGPGGTNPTYVSLNQALNKLNYGGVVTGNVTFYITSNLTEASNVCLGINPAPYTVTIKPYTGTVDTIRFTQQADNVGRSGAWVIGVPSLSVTSSSNYGMVTTENIIIDGSNTDGGKTRDLTIMTSANQSGSTTPITTIGDVNNVTIKNCRIIASQAVSYAISLADYNSSTFGNGTPDSITVDNCEIYNTYGVAGQGIAITNAGTGTPTTFSTAMVFSNNKIYARTRGIFLNYAGNTNVFGNEVNVTQTTSGYISYGIWGYVIGNASNITNIYNNKVLTLYTANAAAGTYGIVGIEAGSKGTYNIYNNMICGFSDSTTTPNPNSLLIGIRSVTAGVSANIYFNSVFMPDIPLTPGTGNLQYSGIVVSNATNVCKNNIVVSNNNHFPSYCINKTGTSGTLVSDYNDFYVSDTSGNAGYWNATARKTLANWRDSSLCDSNSISVNPGFKAANDLHLSANTSPVIGKGIPISSITTDIDGELRDTPPELGADEIPGVVPVELTSFTANLVENRVALSWSTATETNNSRFEIEKKMGNTNWTNIGSIAGNGTSTKVHTYTFIDSKVDFVKATYRIKQVDFDGSYSYSKEVEVSASAPVKFELNQNYPNPFNPVTIISYSIPVSSPVKLEVYSITGQRVKILVDETQSAGLHNMKFDGSSLASGVYIYRLTAGKFVVSKKMQLIK